MIAAVCVVACLAPALPAAALDVSTSGTQRVLGELRTQRLTIRLDDGRVARGDVLRFPETDRHLTLRPHLARNQVLGLETTAAMANRLRPGGAVAGTNGGYWISRPSGNPNGLHVQGGRMFGSNASTTSGGERTRAAFGIQPNGRTVFDRVRVDMELRLPDNVRIPIRHLNRGAYDGRKSEVLLYDRHYGGSFAIPAGATLLVLDQVALPASGRVATTVRSVRRYGSRTSASVASGTTAVLLIGTHSRGPVESLSRGTRISIDNAIVPASGAASRWQGIEGALPGAGLLVRDGNIPAIAQWTADGFSSQHFTARHPRTGIGRTRNGEVLMITVDGRQSRSVGVTGREFAEVFRALGAIDAVNLDGGGSTTMVVDNRIRNRPSESGRSIASGLFIHAPLPPSARTPNRACPPGQVPSSGFRDTRGSVHSGTIDCLAWWRITAGKTRSSYDPNGSITRGQMASMLARWIDDAAQRGSGRALPSSTSHPFRDVPRGHTHERNIARLHNAGIINGTSARRFQPNAPVTRAAFASLLSRGFTHVTGSTLPRGRDTFTDDNGSVHEASIDRLANARILTGLGGHRVGPNGSLTRAAMASLVMRASDVLVERGVVRPPSSGGGGGGGGGGDGGGGGTCLPLIPICW